MSCYVIGCIQVRDSDKWQEYVSQVGATFSPFGGEVVFRGDSARVLDGTLDAGQVVCIRFADQDAALRWYGSAEYQRLIPVRNAAADVVLISYDSA